MSMEKCAICGEEYPEADMTRYFTGRPKFVCRKCAVNGNRQVEARNKEFLGSAEGRKLLERKRKERQTMGKVYIRSMNKKPAHCAECPICNGDDDCDLLPKWYDSWDAQYADCPLEDEGADDD